MVLARNYIENLREEVKKGMREKAEQGIYPSRPPFGYRNNTFEHTIEIDTASVPALTRMFELYASGQHSLQDVWKTLKREFDIELSKSNVEKLLKNPFYIGGFYWDGKLYRGTHSPLITQVFLIVCRGTCSGGTISPSIASTTLHSADCYAVLTTTVRLPQK